MARIEQTAIDGLKVEREKLLAIKKSDLTYVAFAAWLAAGQHAFLRAEGILGPNSVRNPINNSINGYQQITDLDAVRDSIIRHLDMRIRTIDEQQVVRPILDDLILKVADKKLSTLLNKFNAAKDKQPNIAAVALRTILSLIIREKAKLFEPGSKLATKDDLALEPDIKAALDAKIFEDGEAKRLKGASNNCHRLPGALNLPANDSALFPFRFCTVHPKEARDCHLRLFFEVPSSQSAYDAEVKPHDVKEKRREKPHQAIS